MRAENLMITFRNVLAIASNYYSRWIFSSSLMRFFANEYIFSNSLSVQLWTMSCNYVDIFTDINVRFDILMYVFDKRQ